MKKHHMNKMDTSSENSDSKKKKGGRAGKNKTTWDEQNGHRLKKNLT